MSIFWLRKNVKNKRCCWQCKVSDHSRIFSAQKQLCHSRHVFCLLCQCPMPLRPVSSNIITTSETVMRQNPDSMLIAPGSIQVFPQRGRVEDKPKNNKDRKRITRIIKTKKRCKAKANSKACLSKKKNT